MYVYMYFHFSEREDSGLEDVNIQIIDVTDVRRPTYRETL